MHVVRHLLFVRKHAFHVHVTRAGNQVLRIGVLAGELEAYQVAAVVQIVVFDQAVVAHRMPTRRLDRPNLAALLRRHGLFPYQGKRNTTAPQRIELAVILETAAGFVVIGELRFVFINLNRRTARVGGNAGKVECRGGNLASGLLRLLRLRWRRAARQQRERQQEGYRERDQALRFQ